jgi:ABC-type multidrug transport system ATPase subunit
MAQSTTVIVAHRVATLRHADHIIVLDGGRVAEAGTHDQLVAHGGIYASLHRRQSRSDALEKGLDLRTGRGDDLPPQGRSTPARPDGGGA